MSSKKRTIVDSLRQAIIDSDIPYLRFEEKTGLSRGSISRFVNGERDIYFESAALLAEELNLRLIPRTRKSRRN